MNNTKKYRIIFHIDMNAFFASCEIANNLELKDKPVVVAHNDPFRKSIILTANYEARKYGIKTTMMVKEAIKLCPFLVVVEPNYQLYQQYSNLFFKYLYTVTNKIEIASIDEGYLDITDVCQPDQVLSLAKKIQKDLLEIHNLPCSIGIAPNKFLAKMASDMKKPLGITVLRKREISQKLWPLSIGDMFGVGKKTKPKLEGIGIHTIGDVANFKNRLLLEETVGKAMAEYLLKRSNGIDDNEVETYSLDDVSSVSNAHTFSYSVFDINLMKETLKVLSNTVSDRLERKNLCAQTIGVQIKYANFKFINRSRSLENKTNDNKEIWSIVEELFDENYDSTLEVRLLGVFANRVSEKQENIKKYTLFDDFEKISKEDNVTRTLREIKKQFGDNTINVGYYKYEKDEKK